MRLPLFLLALATAVAPGLSAVAAPAAAPAARAPQPGEADYTPDGAPRDDYNFTAWCRGVLEGHMALAEHVQSVLPLDEVQQKVGAAYLKGYDEALRIGRRGRSDAEIDAAEAIRFAARANWNTAMQSPLQLGADTYLAWQLPGRCEHAAKRVAKRDDIFQMGPGSGDTEAMSSRMNASDELSPARVQAPAAVAAPSEPAPARAPVEDPQLVSVDALTMSPVETYADETTAAVDPVIDETAPPAAAEAAPEPAPVEVATAPAGPAPAAQPARDSNGRLISMPRKGRLFPWGRRE
jgi:hypothetical protein